jgi:hypothetical protein
MSSPDSGGTPTRNCRVCGGPLEPRHQNVCSLECVYKDPFHKVNKAKPKNRRRKQRKLLRDLVKNTRGIFNASNGEGPRTLSYRLRAAWDVNRSKSSTVSD